MARYQVLPLDNRRFSAFVLGRPVAPPERARFVYWPHRAPVPEAQAAPTRNRPHTITTHVSIPPAATGSTPVEGVSAVQGSVLGGWSFHVRDRHLVYVHNLSGWREYRLEAPLGALSPGDHRLAFRYEPDERGRDRGAAA